MTRQTSSKSRATAGVALSSGDRVRLMRQRVRASGGGIITVTLGPESYRALQALAEPGERNALIERLIEDEYRSRKVVSGR